MNLNNMRNVKMPNAGPAGALAKLVVIGGLGLYGAVNSLYNVEGGHRAIVFNRIVGVKDKVREGELKWVSCFVLSIGLIVKFGFVRFGLSPVGVFIIVPGFGDRLQVYPEGTHFMIPWFDRPVIYDVRARPNIVESTSGSRDLQMVSCLLTCG